MRFPLIANGVLPFLLISTCAAAEDPAADLKPIPQAAAASPDLEIVAGRIVAAGKVPASGAHFHFNLRDHGPFTLFAPTNQAFEAVPKDVQSLLLHPNAANGHVLVELLSGHVVGGKVMPEDFAKLDGKGLLSIQGSTLPARVVDGKVMIDGATVIRTIECTNGVIHVIDRILAVDLTTNFRKRNR